MIELVIKHEPRLGYFQRNSQSSAGYWVESTVFCPVCLSPGEPWELTCVTPPLQLERGVLTPFPSEEVTVKYKCGCVHLRCYPLERVRVPPPDFFVLECPNVHHL